LSKHRPQLTPQSKLSVIVPVYNVARYLPICLDSLLAQSRPLDEILLIDDGSTDACPAILSEYAAGHPSLRVIRRENGGLAAARNTGLDAASGEWVGFVDSDDWVVPTMFERLLALANDHALDIALCNGLYHFDGRRADAPIYTDPPRCGPLPGREWLKYKLGNRSLLHMVWMHLYRRDFIEGHRLRFLSGLVHEDVVWTTRALMLAPRVAYDDTPLYVYRKPLRRAEPVARDRHLRAVIASSKINAQALAALADGAEDPELARLIRWQLVDGNLSVFHKVEQLSDAAERRGFWIQSLSNGFLRLLWRNAQDARQCRKVASRWARAQLKRLSPVREATPGPADGT